MGFLLFLLRELFDEHVQFLEAFLPDAPVAFEPIVHLAKGSGAQLVEPLLRARLDIDEPGLFEHTQVLGDLRLVESKSIANVIHGARAGAEKLDDAVAVWFGESRERIDHPA
jgi:hypothetical protein